MKWRYRAHLLGVMGDLAFGCPPAVGTVRAFTLRKAVTKALRQAIRTLRPDVGEYVLLEKVERSA